MYDKIKNRIQEPTKNSYQPAFTIVEILIVIVIIGILATIVIIFYIGTHEKAIDGSLQADLKNSSTLLELDKTNNDLYPSTIENANNGKGLKPSNGAVFDYSYNDEDNSYCLTASKEGRSFYIESAERVPKKGSCPVGNVAVGSFFKTWGGNSYSYGNSTIQTIDGGYAMTGDTYSYGTGLSDVFLAKFKADGSEEWSKAWGGIDEDRSKAIIQTSDGGYAVAGETASYGTGQTDAFLTKYTAAGVVSWSKTWGGTNDDKGGKLAQTSDGGYIMAGSTNSYGGSGYSAFLAKYTSDGSLTWSKTWSGPGWDFASAVVQTSDGGYAVAGTTDNGSNNDDVFLAKYTSDGTLSWSRTWGGNGYDNGISMVQSSDGGYAVTGEVDSNEDYGQDMFILKFTTDGALSWSRAWGGLSGIDRGNSIIQASDGGYVIAGTTDIFSPGANDDAVIVKYAPDGNLSWAKAISGFNPENGNGVAQASDGGYLLAGITASYGGVDQSAFLAKFTADGSIANCNVAMCKNPTGDNINLAFSANGMTAVTASPTITSMSINANETAVYPQAPVPAMTTVFSGQELYIAYPGTSQKVCKQWTAPGGKTIKGFMVSQETEQDFDYFEVSFDGIIRYNQSGFITDYYVDTSNTPANTIKTCLTTDEFESQGGYGGQVTGVIYN